MQKGRGRPLTYFITFLEGLTSFISPCMLPMLPVYISFFAGGNQGGGTASPSVRKTLINASAFTAGFTAVFVLFGVFASAVGGLLSRYGRVVDVVTGSVVVIFGLNYIGVFKIPVLSKTFRLKAGVRGTGVLSSFVFGIIFSAGWTPCAGPYLGSSLMLASRQGSVLKGVATMLCYSAGLGIPFIAAAALTDRLKAAFDFIKRHYRAVNIISGVFLIAVGILMMTGSVNYYLSLMTA